MAPLRLDRYLLGMVTRPFAAGLIVGLAAVLLKRLLEVVTEIVQAGGQLFLWRLVAAMISIYAGDLIPAALLFGVFLVVARLCENAEIDAMLASGMSIGRIAAPYFATGLGLALVSLLFLGFLQPYGRYGYKTALFAAENAGWSAEIKSGAFLDSGDGYVLSADHADPYGKTLHGVFIRRALAGGGEQVITAASGIVDALPGGHEVAVHLQHGAQLERTSQRTKVTRFNSAEEIAQIRPSSEVMRSRGADPRERTLPELIRALGSPQAPQEARVTAAELYARLAESLAIALIPLMAVPLGMAAKRTRRASGLILGGVLLMGFQHALQLTKSMAQTGYLQPAPAIATVFGVWAALCLWMFLSSRARPGDNPLSRLMDAVQAALAHVRSLFAQNGISAPTKA